MDTTFIRKMIEDAFADEKRTSRLKKAIAGLPLALSKKQRRQLQEFVEKYIEDTPTLLEAMAAAGHQMGISQTVDTILVTAMRYWADPNDLIPDRLGLVGLVDDAYFSHSLIQQISTGCLTQAGSPLLNVDLSQANAIIRGIIGEPHASQLDIGVMGALQMPAMQQALSTFGGFGGSLSIPSRDFEGCTLDEYVDIQMGAAGII